jgi:hypothetical protein
MSWQDEASFENGHSREAYFDAELNQIELQRRISKGDLKNGEY